MVTINPVSKYPVHEDAFVIRDLLQRILDDTVGIYEAAGIPLPSRRYWCFGQAAEDCDQLVVVFLNANLGTPGEQQTEPSPCSGPKFATIEVRVSRDMVNSESTNAPPRAERIQQASEWMAIDAWTLLDNLQTYDMTSLGTRGAGVLANVTTPAPSGNLQTTVLTLTIGLL